MIQYYLKTEGLDEERAERVFTTYEAAEDAAIVWFISGYAQHEGEPLGIGDDVILLVATLREGREFVCGRYYEQISIEQVGMVSQ